ncbi:MAG TPA: HD domain-containing protein [Micromonosporaceae bacterium]|nr:HD domain-containing protein [Micromonosporaceae bacterium]
MTPPPLISDARDLAQILLGESPRRWRHTVGVARRAEDLIVTLDRGGAGGDADVLIAAAWLHDIGYADPVRDTGFHPVDGARHLDRLGWPARIAALVAHHSDARSLARARGVPDLLAAYPHEESAVADALTYADQTVGPDGRRMGLTERLADMLRRHGPDSPNAVAHPVREPNLRAAADRVQRRLVVARSAG